MVKMKKRAEEMVLFLSFFVVMMSCDEMGWVGVSFLDTRALGSVVRVIRGDHDTAEGAGDVVLALLLLFLLVVNGGGLGEGLEGLDSTLLGGAEELHDLRGRLGLLPLEFNAVGDVVGVDGSAGGR